MSPGEGDTPKFTMGEDLESDVAVVLKTQEGWHLGIQHKRSCNKQPTAVSRSVQQHR